MCYADSAAPFHSHFAVTWPLSNSQSERRRWTFTVNICLLYILISCSLQRLLYTNNLEMNTLQSQRDRCGRNSLRGKLEVSLPMVLIRYSEHFSVGNCLLAGDKISQSLTAKQSRITVCSFDKRDKRASHATVLRPYFCPLRLARGVQLIRRH